LRKHPATTLLDIILPLCFMTLSIPKIEFEDPAIVYDRARQEMDAMDQSELFTAAGSRYQKMRERWCTGVFGIGYGRHIRPCRVAVNDTRSREDADFFLEVGDQRFPFQSAECQDPGRRRGDEYRRFATGAPTSMRYEPEKGRTEGPSWIATTIANKIARNYSRVSDLRLLVYANFNAHQLELNDIRIRTRPHEGRFASVWIITNMHLCAVESDAALGGLPEWKAVFDLRA
jgi:hypothetical protein